VQNGKRATAIPEEEEETPQQKVIKDFRKAYLKVSSFILTIFIAG